MKRSSTPFRRCLAGAALCAVLGACGESQSLSLGAALPLTGEYQLYGQSIRKGVELAFEELRQTEDGDRWSLDILDSESDATKSAELVARLFESGAVAVIGGVITDEALQSVPVAERFDRVLISPSASSPELTGISKQFYRVFISDAREGAVMAQFAVEDLSATDVVILAKETAYARGIQEVFRSNFERLGGQVVEFIEFPEHGGDLSGLTERVTTLAPSAVYLAGYAEDISAMIRGLRAEGYQGLILTTAAFSSPAVIEQVGAAAENVLLTQTDFDPTAEQGAVRQFVEAYRAAYGLTPDIYAAHGYDAVRVLVAAIEGTDGGPTEVWSGLRALRDFQGVTGPLQFDERGDVQKFPRVYRVSGGQLVDHAKDLKEKQDELRRRREELQRRIAAAAAQTPGP